MPSKSDFQRILGQGIEQRPMSSRTPALKLFRICHVWQLPSSWVPQQVVGLAAPLSRETFAIQSWQAHRDVSSCCRSWHNWSREDDSGTASLQMFLDAPYQTRRAQLPPAGLLRNRGNSSSSVALADAPFQNGDSKLLRDGDGLPSGHSERQALETQG